ncbi:MAG: hypothetical protein FJ100_10660 [Deltaproteobacteria bacterium]|nr:hypothetical protein [Deltaproteobacteria bacterium]
MEGDLPMTWDPTTLELGHPDDTAIASRMRAPSVFATKISNAAASMGNSAN